MDEWPADLAFLRDLEELMKCPICFDLMQAPVMLPSCEHNYCSLCIRRYFCQREQCPTCGSLASSNQLRSNGIMEKTIEQFKKIRSPLRSLCVNRLLETPTSSQSDSSSKSQEVQENKNTLRSEKSPSFCRTRRKPNKAQDGPVTTSRSRKRQAPQSSSDSEDSDIQIISEDENCSFTNSKLSISAPKAQQCVLPPSNSSNLTKGMKPRNVQSKLFVLGDGSKTSAKENLGTKGELTASRSVRSAEVSPKVASPLALSLTKSAAAVNSSPKVLSVLMTSQNKKDVNVAEGSGEADKVPCPVCGVPVITSFVNRHLDLCLGRQEKQAAQKEKRKPLPKLVYNLMSEKDIRKRLKDLGLACKGDRQALVKRHHEFTMYHNADCDSIAPKDLNELVKDFEDMQNMQAKQSSRSPSSSHSILRFTKDSKQEDIEKAQKDYVARHKDQFQSLIKEARKRMKSAQKPPSSTSSSSAGSAPDSGVQECIQGQSAASVTLDTAVPKGKLSYVSDDGDEVDGEIASTSETRTITKTQETRCSVLKSDDDITCPEEIVESETAISETQNSADDRNVLSGDVVVSKDPHKDTVLCSSQLQTASAELADEAVPKPDLVRENADSEENDMDVFENDPKSQCVQSTFKSSVRGKRALRSSKPSWQDTDCEGPSLSPCRSQVSGGSKNEQRKPSCKMLPSESVDEENCSPGDTQLRNSSDGSFGLPDAQKLLDPPGSDIPPEVTGQHQATSAMESCGKGTMREVCSAKDSTFTELPGRRSENLDAGITNADSMATNNSIDRETECSSIQKTANQSQPEAAVTLTYRMQEVRESGTRTHKEQRNTRNVENENHTEESVTSLHLLTASSEVEEDGNETSTSGEANHLHGLLADPSLSDGGENMRPDVSDNRDNKSDPRTARDCFSENKNVCFEVDLSDCEDEELLPVMEETDSVSLKGFICPQNGHGQELPNTCESDLKKNSGTPGNIGASHLNDDNPQNVKETNLTSEVHEVDQETNFSAKPLQVATLKSVLRKKLDKDSLLKKSVRFAGLRARISDIENEGDEHKLAKERSDSGKHKGEISFVDAAVSRDEAVFLADLRKMGCQDRTRDLKKGDYLETVDCVSVEAKGDGVSLEDEEEGLSAEDKEEGTSLENRGEDVSLEDKEEGICLEGRGEGMSLEDKEEDMSSESRGEGMSLEDKKEGISLEYRGEGMSLEDKGNCVSVKDEGEHVSLETSAVCEVNECTVAAATLCSQKQNKKTERSGVKEKKQRNRKTNAVDTTIESITTEISEHSCEPAADDLGEAKNEIHRGYGKIMSKGKKKKHSALPTIPEDFTSLKELNEERNWAQSVAKNQGGATCVIAQAVATENKGDTTECDHEQNGPYTSAFPDVHSNNTAEEEVSLIQNCGSDTISRQPPRLNRKSYPSAMHVSQTASECSSAFEKPKDMNVSNSKHRRKRANSSADKYDNQTATSESCIQVKTVGTAPKRRKTRQSGDSMTLNPIPEVCLEPQNNTMSTLQTVPEMVSETEKPLENTERQLRTEHKTRKGSGNIEKRSRTEHRSRKQRSSRCGDDTPAQTQQAVPVEDKQGEKTEKGRTRKRRLCEVSTSEGKGSE